MSVTADSQHGQQALEVTEFGFALSAGMSLTLTAFLCTVSGSSAGPLFSDLCARGDQETDSTTGQRASDSSEAHSTLTLVAPSLYHACA